MKIKFLMATAMTFLLLPIFLVAQVPPYYSNIDFSLDGNALKAELSELIIDTHTNLIPYTSNSTDTWDIIHLSDADVSVQGNVILFYGYNDADNETINDRTRAITYQSSGLCIGYWNREHVFAKSLANPSLVTDEPGPGTDVHNLRAADCQMNSRRNNNYFRDGSGNSFLDGEFYPGDEFKGDVARIIMYMYLRYPSQCEPSNIGVGSASYSDYGDMPNLFLDWNEEDPVSDFERDRNDVIYSYQGNRNPFIDNPYLALKIWNGPDLVDSWEVLSSPNLAFQRLSVYPTITNDYLYIQGTGVVRNSIEIFNQLGQALEFELDENKIDVTSFSNGLYIMNINNSNQSKLFKFLVY